MNSIASGLTYGALTSCLLSPALRAEDVGPGNLVVTQAWSRATPGRAKVAGGYVTDFIRDARAGGCAVGVPPDNLGFRLVIERSRWSGLRYIRDRLTPMLYWLT